MKLYRASSCFRSLNDEEPKVTRTIAVLVIREMSTSDIHTRRRLTRTDIRSIHFPDDEKGDVFPNAGSLAVIHVTGLEA